MTYFSPSLSRSSCSLSPVLSGVETSHRNSQDNTGVWLMRNVTSIQQTCKEDVTAACTQALTFQCVFAPEHPAHLLPSCSTQTFLKLGPFLQSLSKFPPLSPSLPVLVKQRILSRNYCILWETHSREQEDEHTNPNTAAPDAFTREAFCILSYSRYEQREERMTSRCKSS